jgi:hypothetical protein
MFRFELYNCIVSEVVNSVNIKLTGFWYVTTRIVVDGHQRFGVTCLYLENRG